MSLIIIFFCIVILILLITRVKLNAFLAFIIVSALAGILLGMDLKTLAGSLRKGMGDLLGSLVIVIVSGAMLGKLVAESGAAQKIASGLMKIFGTRYINWALMVTGFIIGIPLFYNVGFVLVIPLIFSVAYRVNLPVLYVGLPMLTALSVTHGFLPPHPAPTALVGQLGADIGQTLLYGIIIAIPTVLIGGPLFAPALKKLKAKPLETFKPTTLPEDQLPGLAISICSSLFPVFLLILTTLFKPLMKDNGKFGDALLFVSDPDIVMFISLMFATYSLGLRMKMSVPRIMGIYGDAVKDIAMMLLIIGGAGSLKQVLIDSNVNQDIVALLNGLNANPLVLGWLIAAVLRICLGSATVAGITAAGIVAPIVAAEAVDPNLMVLSVGAGSLLFSHVNDAGFWLFKEYFNLSIKDTMRSWSIMETIVSVVGLVCVMILDIFV
jgi:Gnt-I system high-affinity gluconate transporter